MLASYSLQADLGNYSEESNKGRYFEPAKYFPHWVLVISMLSLCVYSRHLELYLALLEY